MRKLAALMILPLILTRCPLLVAGAAGEAAISTVEERPYSVKVEDQNIYVKVNDQLIKSGHDGLVIDATVNVRYSRVLLTGNLDSQTAKEKAGMAAWKVKGVKEVFNETIVNPDAGFSNSANDVLIHKNFVSRLLITKDVWSINYSSDVVNGTLYIIGLTQDRAELNRVLNVARTTKGVKRVVSHLQVKSEMPSGMGSAVPSDDTTYSAAPMSPVVPVDNGSAATPMPPTDGTISTDSVTSSDLSAPSAPAPVSAPTPAPASKPTWK